MSRFGPLSRALLLAIAACAFAAAEARADLIIRVTSETSGGAVLGTATDTVVLSNPPPALASQAHTFMITDFDVVITDNIARTSTGATRHSLTINFTYTGPVASAGPPATTSDQLIVEFLGTNYINPTTGDRVQISSNASPSTAGLIATSVTMQSGVSTTDAGLPGTPGSTAGLSGTTTGTGSLGTASSLLLPNPVVGAPFTLTGPNFSFYQAFTIANFTNTGDGSISAGSTVANPEPSSLAMVAMGAPVLVVGLWKRRRVKA